MAPSQARPVVTTAHNWRSKAAAITAAPSMVSGVANSGRTTRDGHVVVLHDETILTRRVRYRHLTTRDQNKLKPTQAQTVIAAALLRQLWAVVTTGRAWDGAIAANGHNGTQEVIAVA